MKKILLITFALGHLMAIAQNKKKQDTAAILAMCGCYDVSFNFAETFSPQKDYVFHDNYTSGGLEYVLPIEQTKDKIVLQHLLIVGDTMIIKHWRQDWLYENTDFYTFHKENTWQYESKKESDVKRQWTQKVYQVDDSPRYEGSSSWVHADGKSFWENTADAPLPRREFSQRSDYNVMIRRNRHEITTEGWIHDQDNDKVIREDDDQLLAQEKGWNSYLRTEDEKCQLAKDWWNTNQAYWADVRLVWDELFETKKTIALEKKVNEQLLFMRLFDLGDEVSKQEYNSENARERIRESINLHLKNDLQLSFNQ